MRHKILVLGGYEQSGKSICELLADNPNIDMIVAGTDLHYAEVFVKSLKDKHGLASISATMLDWQAEDFSVKLQKYQPALLIHTAGPFQTQDYTIVKACLALNIHYLDLSDVRDFVQNIIQFDEQAKERGLVLISGATSVPGLSTAVVANYVNQFSVLREIDFGIAHANKIELGSTALQNVLEEIGKPFQQLEQGQWKTVYGSQNLHKHYYGDNIGLRWHANRNVPDLDLLPQRYPKLKTVTFHVGWDVTWLHFLMWNLSWLSRLNIIKRWTFFQKPISLIQGWISKKENEVAGMYVKMYGSNHRYQPLELNWVLVAEKGHGQFISAIPSVILTEKILRGEVQSGAQPCVALFMMEDFYSIASKFKIYHTFQETEY